MENEFKITKELIQLHQGFESWQDAVRHSAQPLVVNDYISEAYVQAIIDSVIQYGPYIVIAPNIAMPHARPEAGSKKVGFSVSLYENPIAFGETDDLKAQLLITLSCVDAETHLKMLQSLVTVLGTDDNMEKLCNANSVEEIINVFN